MVFKSVCGSRPGGAATCVVITRGWSAKQDHPAYIPRILRPVWPYLGVNEPGSWRSVRDAPQGAGGDDHNLFAAAVWPLRGTREILVGVAGDRRPDGSSPAEGGLIVPSYLIQVA